MNTLTPQILIDNLNKNYEEIVGNAIYGYYRFYEIEQDFLSKTPKSLTLTEVDKDKMNYLIAYANIIQYGKSYFFGEIIKNFIEMDNLSEYINNIGPLLNNEKKESSVVIEELEGGGGNLLPYFLKFIVIFLIMDVTNVTSVGTTFALLNQVSISVEIDVNKEEMPQVYGFQEELDPRNETMLIKFTQQYKQNFRFPTDRVLQTNVTDLYKQATIKNMRDNMSLFGSLFVTDKHFNEKFVEAMRNETVRINMLSKDITLGLEEVCRSFVRTTDQNLPIELFRLLNSKLASKLDKLREEKIKITQQKEQQIRSKEIGRLGLTGTEEPGLTQILSKDIKSTATNAYNSISGFFPSFILISSKTSQDVVTTQRPTTEQLIEVYDNVDEAVNNAITELSEEINLEAFQTIASEVLQTLGKEAMKALEVTNLRIYLTAICQIKRPTYVFNETDGLLYIKDPVRSRTHLKVLAQNVVSYYSTVIQGIQHIENGEVITDIPSDERRLNMKSLLEKSQLIIEILTNYDTGLTKSLLDSDSETDYKIFFENIASMWMGIKNQTIAALSQFPITERENVLKLTREKEATMFALKEKMEKHDKEMRTRVQELLQNRELTNLTKAEWQVMNEWFSVNTGGALKMGTEVINNLVNSTTEVGTNLLENGEILADKGIAGLTSLAWAIAKFGMIISIPALLFLSIKAGFITVLFKKAVKQLEDTPPVPGNPHFQSTNLTVIPSRNQMIQSFYGRYGIENYNRFEQGKEEGEEYEPDRLYGGRFKKHKKTRKNKKRKTRKLKHGKRRQTKHKRLRPTRRHKYIISDKTT